MAADRATVVSVFAPKPNAGQSVEESVRVIAHKDAAVMGWKIFFASDLYVKMIALKDSLKQLELRGFVC